MNKHAHLPEFHKDPRLDELAQANHDMALLNTPIPPWRLAIGDTGIASIKNHRQNQYWIGTNLAYEFTIVRAEDAHQAWQECLRRTEAARAENHLFHSAVSLLAMTLHSRATHDSVYLPVRDTSICDIYCAAHVVYYQPHPQKALALLHELGDICLVGKNSLYTEEEKQAADHHTLATIYGERYRTFLSGAHSKPLK